MTWDEQVRIAKCILRWEEHIGECTGWTCNGEWVSIHDECDPRWLWPLRVALEEAGWEFEYDEFGWHVLTGGDYVVGISIHDTAADATNAAALVELAEREKGE